MGSTWGEADVPDQAGKVALVTGANSGIGFETARVLAERGAHVLVACRDEGKAAVAVEAMTAGRALPGRLEVLRLDLADLASVRAAAATVLAEHATLDLLVNNAGVMALPKRELTVDGFERQLGTNHLGHVALTGLLLGPLLAAPAARIVAVSSQAHRMGKIHMSDLQSTRRYSAWGAYGQSKLANLLFTFELQRRLALAGQRAIAVAAHPGFARTNLAKANEGWMARSMELFTPVINVMSQSAAMGALPTLRAATDPAVVGGQYFGPDGPGEQKGHPRVVSTSTRAKDPAVARELWTESFRLVGVDVSQQLPG